MGFLTPFLFRNDSISALHDKNMLKQICDKLYAACIERQPQSISFNSPKGGVNCNAIECLGTAHVDENRLIAVFGNTWIDLNKIDKEYLSDKTHRNYFKLCLDVAKRELKYAEKRFKKIINSEGITGAKD